MDNFEECLEEIGGRVEKRDDTIPLDDWGIRVEELLAKVQEICTCAKTKPSSVIGLIFTIQVDGDDMPDGIDLPILMAAGGIHGAHLTLATTTAEVIYTQIQSATGGQ